MDIKVEILEIMVCNMYSQLEYKHVQYNTLIYIWLSNCQSRGPWLDVVDKYSIVTWTRALTQRCQGLE